MPLISKTDLIVIKHRKEKKAGKQAVFKVEMQTVPTHNPQMKLTLTSDNDLRQDFPLDGIFTISIDENPQTKLETE